MKAVKIFFIVLALIVSIEANAQGPNGPRLPRTSKSIKGCVNPSATSQLKLKNGQIDCDQKTGILWVEGIEDQADKTKLVHENATLDEINKAFGEIRAYEQATVNAKKLREVKGFHDDVYKNGSDISVDTFILSESEETIIVKDANGNYIPKRFVDNEWDVTMEGENGEDINVGGKTHGWFPLKMFDESNEESETQVIMHGTEACSKPQRKAGINWRFLGFSKKRAYVDLLGSVQLCYGDTLGINLPAGFKSGTSNLGIKAVLPYSQQGPEGQELDFVGLWKGITKKQYNDAKYILLTSGKVTDAKKGTKYPRVVIGLTKNPVKITQ